MTLQLIVRHGNTAGFLGAEQSEIATDRRAKGWVIIMRCHSVMKLTFTFEKHIYLYFNWVFLLYAALYFYSATSQREILYFFFFTSYTDNTISYPSFLVQTMYLHISWFWFCFFLIKRSVKCSFMCCLLLRLNKR